MNITTKTKQYMGVKFGTKKPIKGWFGHDRWLRNQYSDEQISNLGEHYVDNINEVIDGLYDADEGVRKISVRMSAVSVTLDTLMSQITNATMELLSFEDKSGRNHNYQNRIKNYGQALTDLADAIVTTTDVKTLNEAVDTIESNMIPDIQEEKKNLREIVKEIKG